MDWMTETVAWSMVLAGWLIALIIIVVILIYGIGRNTQQASRKGKMDLGHVKEMRDPADELLEVCRELIRHCKKIREEITQREETEE